MATLCCVGGYGTIKTKLVRMKVIQIFLALGKLMSPRDSLELQSTRIWKGFKSMSASHELVKGYGRVQRSQGKV